MLKTEEIFNKRVSDNEIIKALERMSKEDPNGFSSDILDLINRKNAEIERLRGPSRDYPFCNLLGGCLVFSKNLKDYNDMRKGLKSEARKEFAEKLKAIFNFGIRVYDGVCTVNGVVKNIDSLLAEMEERENDLQV